MRGYGAVLAALLAGGLAGAAPAVAAATPPVMTDADAGRTMHRIAAAPYRYGGTLQGTIPGATAAMAWPLHISIGLEPPDAQGRLRGEAILFDRQRRLVGTGPVTGTIGGGPTAGTGGCALRLSLPAVTMALSGLCTATQLSGEIVSTPAQPGALVRLISWWGDGSVSGEYWLTPGSFDPPA